MSGTATITWSNPTPSNPQELYYGKDTLVSGLPGSGGGWIADSNNPLSGTTGSQTISNLDDNVKYAFLVRADCANTTDTYSRSSALKWVCGGIQTQGPTGGILSYTLSVDPSVSNAGSAVGILEVYLVGVDRNNASVTIKSNRYTLPFSSSYTDQFNGVIGNIDWTLKVRYRASSYPNDELHECSSQAFSTSTQAGITLIHIRNGLTLGTLSQVTIASTSSLPVAIDAGYGTNIDISALTISSSSQQVACTIPDVQIGTQLFARQIRGGIQIAGGLFTYIGSNTNITSTPLSLQNGDVIEVVNSDTLGYVFAQPLVTKTTTPSNGYNITPKIDIPQGSDTQVIISFREFDYSSGTTIQRTSGTIVIPQGSTTIAPVFLASSLTVDQYNRATIVEARVGTATSTIAVPYYYST